MKEQHVKILVRVLAVLAAVLIIRYSYLWIRRQFSGLESHALDSSDNLAGATVTSAYAAGNAFPLKQGSAGSNVVKLQQFLNAYGGASLTVDGKFGPKTKAALAAYNGKTSVTQTDLASWINSKIKNIPASGSAGTTGAGNSGDWSGSSGGGGGGFGTTGPDYFSDENTGGNYDTDSAQYPSNITDYASELKTDLDSTYVFSTRDKSGVYAQALMLSPADLKRVATIFKETYGENLYQRINTARFSVNSNADILIKNKLIACGAGPSY